jgi:hypothetical protein
MTPIKMTLVNTETAFRVNFGPATPAYQIRNDQLGTAIFKGAQRHESQV